MFEAEEKNMTYLNKNLNKVLVNFVKIEMVYSKCYATFSSKSKLYNHLKASYVERALLALFTQLLSSILIIAFKALY